MTQRNNDRRAPRSDKRQGAVYVEFALGFLLFITLVFGVFEGARMIWAYASITHAAREGARYAMVHGHQSPVADSAIETYAEARAPGLAPGDVTVTTTWEDTDKEGSSVVRVQVAYPISMIASTMLFGKQTMNLSYTARAVIAE